MKKLLTSVMILSAFTCTGVAFAEDAVPLTTKTYVDDGLRAVYRVAADAQNDVDALEAVVGDNESGLIQEVNTLKTTVGNSESGLVKGVADNNARISALETTVGNYESGLVKGVADNTSAISALQATVGGASDGLVKAVADLQYDVSQMTDTRYSAGTGITITGANNAISIDGLANTESGKKYVYQNGRLTELGIENNWEQMPNPDPID